MALFKQFKLAARIFLAKKNAFLTPFPSWLFSWPKQYFLKGQILEKLEKATTVSTLISSEFLFSRHKIIPLRLIVDFKVT